jgi:hypothetical protein
VTAVILCMAARSLQMFQGGHAPLELGSQKRSDTVSVLDLA